LRAPLVRIAAVNQGYAGEVVGESSHVMPMAVRHGVVYGRHGCINKKRQNWVLERDSIRRSAALW